MSRLELGLKCPPIYRRPQSTHDFPTVSFSDNVP